MLDFSQRLGALCGNTLAGALALVMFADLSRRAAESGAGDLVRPFGRAALTALALLVPLQVGVFVNAHAIVDVVIAHGDVSAATAGRVTNLIRWVAFAPLGALLARLLFMRVLAEKDLPIIRLVGAGVALDLLSRLALFTLLAPKLGLEAIPVGLAFAPVAPVIFLTLALRRRGAFAWGDAFRSRLPALAASALGSGAIIAGSALGPVVAGALAYLLGDAPKLESIGQLAASGLLGGLALAAGIRLFKVRLKAL
jgi:peptidoglycan biosynthesis protein MviN/MurJ (putative lipid II flippase)